MLGAVKLISCLLRFVFSLHFSLCYMNIYVRDIERVGDSLSVYIYYVYIYTYIYLRIYIYIEHL